MQARFIHDGDAVDYIPATDTPAGSVVANSALVGVTKLPIPAGEVGALALRGVYDLKKGAVAFSLGDLVYWGESGAAKTGTVFFGVAVQAAAQAEESVRVRLIPYIPTEETLSPPESEE